MEDNTHSPAPHSTLHRWELGLVATAAAIIGAPFALPLVGVGTAILPSVLSACGNTTGGLTQAVEGMFGKDSLLSSGVGWETSLTSGIIGVGGAMLGDYIHRHYDKKGQIPWGKVIKYAALATSALIALPSILSGISMGLTFLANVTGGFEAGEWMRHAMEGTIGFSGVAHNAPTGLAGLLPHLFTCGRALLPIGAAAYAATQRDEKSEGAAGYHVQLVSHAPILKGQPSELAFQILDEETGRALGADELKILHTKPLHTMVVDSSLTDYHHLHPAYDEKRQLFTCQFTPAQQGCYSMWSDFTVKGEAQPTHIKTNISALHRLNLPPRISPSSQMRSTDCSLSITAEPPLRAGQSSELTLEIRDAAGQPLSDFEPIMGAYAHLIGFTADGAHFIHSHPMGAEPKSMADRGSSPLHFHITPPASGEAKFFLQIERNGRTQTIPFGQIIAADRSYSTRVSEPRSNCAMAVG